MSALRTALRLLGHAVAAMVWLTPTLAAADDAYRSAKVTYVTSASIYVDAGSDDGVTMGGAIELVRDGAVVAVLKVTYLASHRAVCARESGDATPAVGDAVRFIPAIVPPGAAEGAPAASAPAASRSMSGPGLHGRVGLRYLYVKDTSGAGQKFTQPAADLRLDGSQLGGAPIDLNVDVRARRTAVTDSLGASNTTDLTNVYRMAVSWDTPGPGWRATMGRQFSPSLSVVNIFDGILGEYRGERWAAGAFSGTEPDPVNLGYSSDVREHGAYVEWHNATAAARRWALTTGAVGSYQQSTINREFTFAQGTYTGKSLSLWVSEEVDMNRGWKKQAEGSSFSLTSTLFNLRYRVGTAWTLNAGYDNRRNVRLYRDLVTPVTQFDDQYRTGAWGGASCRFLKRFSAGFDVRTNTGGTLGGASGYSVYLGADRLTSIAFGIRTRSTRYTNDTVDGWLHSLDIDFPIGSRWHLDLTGGVRDETPADPTQPSTSLKWAGLDLDVAIGRHIFAALSVEHGSGTVDAADQGYLTLAYRW
ncbi:MAG: hypothetical protein HY049_11490 [Acidobacteria bacterium]|nr:hypothetical protein [Acidobacteriota bacterium]